MGTTSRGRKPDEWASKVNHTHIINDDFVKNYLDKCSYPKDIQEKDKGEILKLVYEVEDVDNPVEHILAVDGGYTVIEVNKNFPSSELAFFQFGALLFDKKDLTNLAVKPFIFPEDMQKLQKLNRFKLVLPIKNINYQNESSLTNAFRRTLYEFFMDFEGICLMETLKWFLFETYKPKNDGSRKSSECQLEFYTLGRNPNNKQKMGSIDLVLSEISDNYTFSHEDGDIYLTDVFRFHEVIDDELGASGVLGYVTRLVEQIIIIHFIKDIYQLKRALLNKFLFIADGPLSFSGQTANMHKPARNLCNFLIDNYNLHLVGIEKSGAFVDHARKICVKSVPDNFTPKDISGEGSNKDTNASNTTTSRGYLEKNHYLIPSNEYIYTYITIGDAKRMLYGSTSYYSGKVVFHSNDGQIIVVSIPTNDKEDIVNPSKSNFKNIDVILKNIALLRCDMYDDSIVPIALANKLVSLANHPSQILIDKFASSKFT
ncbi:DNA double-strand break repair nuclease NurA [Psychrobacter lutiphocae]|uniref:DNA double-strand break repair nuclease NurA n=1 Tax=Psychrobacter lutiphocae TaxID=540500 RepID=UPI00037F2F2F|nr:DNA double-strand break repair nuclease NurA [Psychrobacter lutiphocae]